MIWALKLLDCFLMGYLLGQFYLLFREIRQEKKNREASEKFLEQIVTKADGQ